jgi:hypothetical protein
MMEMYGISRGLIPPSLTSELASKNNFKTEKICRSLIYPVRIESVP